MASSTTTPASGVAIRALPSRSLADRFWRGSLLTLLLVAADVAAFSLSWLAAYRLRHALNTTLDVPINELVFYIEALVFVAPIWVAATAGHGLYAHREKVSSLAETRSLLAAAKDGLIGSFAVAFLLREQSLGRSVVVMASLFNFAWLCASRMALREFKRLALEAGAGLRRAVIVGGGEVAQRVVDRVARHPEIGYELVGYLASADAAALTLPPSARRAGGAAEGGEALARLGDPDELPAVLAREGIEEVFIAAPEIANYEVLNLVSRCEDGGAKFYLCANILEVITDRVKIDDFGDLPVIPFRGTAPSPASAFAKRGLDLAVASALLLVFAIPMALIALAIRLTTGRPVLFSQRRAGLRGKLFTIYKFRTMTLDTPRYAEAPTEAADPRVTRIGRFLRKTSLDELPQLFNVFAGQMSMVGPRPEMPFIVERYDEWQKRRLDVKPGITGLWQIVGRKLMPIRDLLGNRLRFSSAPLRGGGK
jgi:exopolysaccharide biosynthesis polyprenyl glycosylphosphotransferase